VAVTAVDHASDDVTGEVAMTSFDAQRLDAVLDVTADPSAAGGPLLQSIAEVLAEAAHADSVTIFDLDVDHRTFRGLADAILDDSESTDDDPVVTGMFWDAYPDSVCSWTDARSPWFGRIPARVPLAPESVYPTWRAYQESRIMRTYGRAAGLGHYVIVPLSSDPSVTRRVLVNRPPDDVAFTDDELRTLRLLQPHLDSAVGRALTGRSGEELLTSRELEILGYIRGGRSTQDIAAALWLSPRTVRNHLENVYAKLGVHSRAEAVAYLNGQRSSSA
jgi:DNA-binding CsgD family transcriptional regulator